MLSTIALIDLENQSSVSLTQGGLLMTVDCQKS